MPRQNARRRNQPRRNYIWVNLRDEILPRIQAIHNQNAGHGPRVLAEIAEVVDRWSAAAQRYPSYEVLHQRVLDSQAEMERLNLALEAANRLVWVHESRRRAAATALAAQMARNQIQ